MWGRRACPITTGRHESGQMAVELAVLVPIMLVVGLTVVNLMQFIEACAVFDRVALDAVVSQGVSPSGAVTESASIDAVRSCIESALGSDRCSISVEASGVSSASGSGKGISFPVSPLLTDFTCTLSFHPWPGSFVIAGVPYSSPFVLTHTRSIVVDRFKAGVVV